MLKKLLTIFVFLLLLCKTTLAQNFFQVSMNQPKCFNACDGSATYASTLTGGPFTAVLTNTGSCPNSTLQSSNGNSITLSGLCACAAIYTVSFYNSSNIIVGTELLQVPVTATAPLILQTPTLTPAACPGCCNGEMMVSWSGGYAPAPNNPTITLDGNDISMNTTPYSSVCVGSHTLCVQDLAGCQVCTTFSMNYVITVGVEENDMANSINISPNPFQDVLSVTAATASGNYEFMLISAEGRVLKKGQVPHNGIIETTDLSKGFYILQLQSENKTVLRRKLLKL